VKGDVRGLFNHDPNYPLGRTTAGTMRLSVRKDGLNYEIPDMPKARADVLEAIQRGDVSGNSFAFSVAEEVWVEEDENRTKPHRIIQRVGTLYDVGPVTFPAYEDTAVSARSLDKVREIESRGVVPANVSTTLADRGTAWSKPALGDFTDQNWGDLSDADKRQIAGHFAWSREMPPAAFASLSLPHHRPSDGAVVYRGVAGAAARLDQANIPSADMAKVRAHLAAHYHAFGEQAPWERSDEGVAAAESAASRNKELAAKARSATITSRRFDEAKDERVLGIKP